MGALHDGHISLVRRARRDCGLVVASLFVNPTQFGENEDFDSYPRDEARDLALFGKHGVDIVYAPHVEEMYPDGFGITVTVSGVTEGLCGATRPGHFDGVTTVVSRLFDHCRPDAAYFGEKDYQQLKVIQQMVRDLDLSIRIVGIPVVRERDGLALSSRNAYLDVSERRIAPALQGTMRAVAGRLAAGIDLDAQCRWGRDALLSAGFDSVDYFEIRDGETLKPVDGFRPGLRIFAAAWLRETRLIDNLAVDEAD
jgi:pantoate--beta-alanine ligase